MDFISGFQGADNEVASLVVAPSDCWLRETRKGPSFRVVSVCSCRFCKPSSHILLSKDLYRAAAIAMALAGQFCATKSAYSKYR